MSPQSLAPHPSAVPSPGGPPKTPTGWSSPPSPAGWNVRGQPRQCVGNVLRRAAALNRAGEGGRRSGRSVERRHTAGVAYSCDLLDQFLLQTRACLGWGEAQQTSSGWGGSRETPSRMTAKDCVCARTHACINMSDVCICAGKDPQPSVS